MSKPRPKPVVLCILDGWGESDVREHNAIAQANTPHMDRLRAHYPHGVLSASEGDVGLPGGQMGNSEVGHMNIGAGRIVMQDLPRIDAAIADGSLAANVQLQAFIAALKQSGGTAHLLGLISDGGVHAHQNHIAALASILADAGIPVAVHAFTDGRDVPPKSALAYIAEFRRMTQRHVRPATWRHYVAAIPLLFRRCPTLDRRYPVPQKGNEKLALLLHNYILWPFRKATKPHSLITFATVSGRYYAMDRDKRWERVAAAYRAIVHAESGAISRSAEDVIQCAYNFNDTGDEFIEPHVLFNYPGMRDGDGVLMANFRADRARQLLHALLDPAFDGFARDRVVRFAATLGMVEYSAKLAPMMPAMFPPQSLESNLGELAAAAGLTQLRIAETEKYAHVTFFFSGGREAPYAGEERILIPSPKVATYDLQPEMAAQEVTDQLVAAIESQQFDLIVVNYANTDMVGHSGDIKAAMKAVEAVDHCVGRVAEAVETVGGAMFITADHGNAECMHDADEGQPHTAHTLNLVPSIVVYPAYANIGATLPDGILADVAPTLLDLLGLPKPAVMTGKSLIAHLEQHASVA